MKILKRILVVFWALPLFAIVFLIWAILVIPDWVITGRGNITDIVNDIFDGIESYISKL